MEKREREGGKRAYSAEIRWYSPFVQNEFIRGVRDSHCWESRFLCDKGWQRQIGGTKRVSFPVLQRQRQYQGRISREAGERKKMDRRGRGQTEQVREVNARIFLSEKKQ